MTTIDSYKHLNTTSKLRIELDIEDVAAKLISMNYGVQRLLSAIVRQTLIERPDDELALGILVLLQKGLF
jgi:hypothetical protein